MLRGKPLGCLAESDSTHNHLLFLGVAILTGGLNENGHLLIALSDGSNQILFSSRKQPLITTLKSRRENYEEGYEAISIEI